MKVVVYVEGSSDRFALNALLRPLIEKKQREGIEISFSEARRGDRKKYLLIEVPQRAVNLLRDPYATVVVMPDLYPNNKGFPHETAEELEAGILKNFHDALSRRSDLGHKIRQQQEARFKVFCLKYDLEALILASEKALRKRLGIEHLKTTWKTPVEDQNHDDPPKRIVERLFEENGMFYEATDDAPLILGESNYRDIADKCPQCFKPFVEFLTNIQPMDYQEHH